MRHWRCCRRCKSRNAARCASSEPSSDWLAGSNAFPRSSRSRDPTPCCSRSPAACACSAVCANCGREFRTACGNSASRLHWPLRRRRLRRPGWLAPGGVSAYGIRQTWRLPCAGCRWPVSTGLRPSVRPWPAWAWPRSVIACACRARALHGASARSTCLRSTVHWGSYRIHASRGARRNVFVPTTR